MSNINKKREEREESTCLEIQYQMPVPPRCRREAEPKRERGSGISHQMILSGRHTESHFLSGHLTEWRCLWHTNGLLGLWLRGFRIGIAGDCRPVGSVEGGV